MYITIIGTGYVGLVTGIGLSKIGHHVTLVDNDENKINKIKQGIPTIYEKNLEKDLKEMLKSEKITATTNLTNALKENQTIMICVGTPSKPDGSIDCTYVFNVAKEISAVIQNSDKKYTIIVKSTVVPGTTKKVGEIIKTNAPNANFEMASNPEFLQEGTALENFENPDRIIIGAENPHSLQTLEEMYSYFKCPLIKVDINTAEMIKYASNCFLATKISFANEMGNICKLQNIDFYDVANAIGIDKRISPYFLRAGCGFGGSCFPKDVKAMIAHSKQIGYEPKLLESVIEVNNKQPEKLIQLTIKKIGNLTGKNITLLGLAFKAGTDDTRESPAITILQLLQKHGAKITAYDPKANGEIRKISPNVNYAQTLQDALNASNTIIIATDWPEFKNEQLYEGKIVIDGRKILNKKTNQTYEGICW